MNKTEVRRLKVKRALKALVINHNALTSRMLTVVEWIFM